MGVWCGSGWDRLQLGVNAEVPAHRLHEDVEAEGPQGPRHGAPLGDSCVHGEEEEQLVVELDVGLELPVEGVDEHHEVEGSTLLEERSVHEFPVEGREGRGDVEADEEWFAIISTTLHSCSLCLTDSSPHSITDHPRLVEAQAETQAGTDGCAGSAQEGPGCP